MSNVKSMKLIARLVNDYKERYSATPDQDNIIATILSLGSKREVISCIKKSISKGEADAFFNSSGLLLDLFSSKYLSRKDKKELYGLVETTGIYNELNKKLYSRNYTVRHNAIHTIGRLSNKKYRNLLVQAFYSFYLKKDPYLMSDLLQEIRWLGYKYYSNLLSFLVHHKHIAFRWLSIDLLIRESKSRNRHIRQILSKLGNDPVMEIRIEYKNGKQVDEQLKKIKINISNAKSETYRANHLINQINKISRNSRGIIVPARGFVENVLSINKYRSYSLDFIDRALEYYKANMESINHDIRSAKGDSNLIIKHWQRIGREIKLNNYSQGKADGVNKSTNAQLGAPPDANNGRR